MASIDNSVANCWYNFTCNRIMPSYLESYRTECYASSKIHRILQSQYEFWYFLLNSAIACKIRVKIIKFCEIMLIFSNFYCWQTSRISATAAACKRKLDTPLHL